MFHISGHLKYSSFLEKIDHFEKGESTENTTVSTEMMISDKNANYILLMTIFIKKCKEYKKSCR